MLAQQRHHSLAQLLFPWKPHSKMALVKFSLHTLKEKEQVFVFHCVSVHHCPGLLRGSKEQPEPWPTVHNPAFAPPKRHLCCGPAHCWNLRDSFGSRGDCWSGLSPPAAGEFSLGRGNCSFWMSLNQKLCPGSLLNLVQDNHDNHNMIMGFQSMGGYQSDSEVKLSLWG